MEKYNKLLRNISELIEKGLSTSKGMQKEMQDLLKFKTEIMASKLNLDSCNQKKIQKLI